MIDFRNLARWFSRTPKDIPAAKKCAACGADFTCGAPTDDCWCRTVETTEAERAAMRQNYQDCLCPACLKKNSGKSAVINDAAAK